jgi:ribA/ribD-fused uncharacterized protein
MIRSFRGDYGWASNFYPAPFVVNSVIFKTAEHYFMACKTVDPEWCARIIDAPSAKEAKKIGKICPLRADWDRVKVGVMAQAIWHKFTQNPTLQEKLMRTNPVGLIEGNYWHDNFWGECYCEKCSETTGKNALGKILMAHRKTFITLRELNS